ncbi:MAG: cytidylate kinase-like family protein [Lachnospiraceae bacterium]|nr:cytidylate kinase-like family protein [Lachnospiraceae bacterium]
MKKIITISRQFGACGTTIGRAVAEKLSYEFYNKAVVLNAQKDSNIDISDLVEFDEKVPMDFSFGESIFEFTNKKLSDRLFAAQSDVIKKMGEKGKCVIVGRNSNYILREFDDVLNVFIYANEEFRLAHMNEMHPEYTGENMLKRLKQVDKIREKYCKYYTKQEFTDCRNYDICIDVGSIGIDNAVELLYGLAVK